MKNLTFSQRNGLAPLPEQLKLNEVSEQHRLLLCYHYTEHCRGKVGIYGAVDDWLFTFTRNAWVRHFNRLIARYDSSWAHWEKFIHGVLMSAEYNRLFDFLEFTLTDRWVPQDFKAEIISSFEESRSAYRVIDSQIVAIGQEKQGEVYLRALHEADNFGFSSARAHLVAAGREIASGNWANSVRESIHAVESVARNVSTTKASSLGDALKELEKNKVINTTLKQGFEKIYGYTNGEEGIRHALLGTDQSNVDETDALFMLGACASFVSYLIARAAQMSDDLS